MIQRTCKIKTLAVT